MSQPTAWAESPAAWPEGTVARYLTRAGEALRDPSITVDVSGVKGPYGYPYWCRGCMSKASACLSASFSLDTARERAHQHAEACRALPRPEGT
ncbi:hypothetical protein [Streptomyces syringium]|uniref:hypothetical protein n=1 Tax=Streptomyces syringium TaxID=76729 RepID=UPI003AAB9FF3